MLDFRTTTFRPERSSEVVSGGGRLCASSDRDTSRATPADEPRARNVRRVRLMCPSRHITDFFGVVRESGSALRGE